MGNMGVQSLRSLDIADIKRYVRYLGTLASLSIVLRVCWVLDVVLQVQRAVDKAKTDESESTPTTEGGGTIANPVSDDATVSQQPLTQNMVTTFGLQVALIINYLEAYF